MSIEIKWYSPTYNEFNMISFNTIDEIRKKLDELRERANHMSWVAAEYDELCDSDDPDLVDIGLNYGGDIDEMVMEDNARAEWIEYYLNAYDLGYRKSEDDGC